MRKRRRKLSTFSFDQPSKTKQKTKPHLSTQLHTKLFKCRHIYTRLWSRQNPRTGWPKEPTGMQSGCPRVASRKQNSCVGAVFCQTNPSQAHFWNMGSEQVNLQLKGRSALNLSGGNICNRMYVQPVLISVGEGACVQIPKQKTSFERKLSMCVNAMHLFKYKNHQKHFPFCSRES